MTLLITCLIMYSMELGMWWYIGASALWAGHVAFHALAEG